MASRRLPLLSGGAMYCPFSFEGIVPEFSVGAGEALEGTGFREIGACFIYDGGEDTTRVCVCKGFPLPLKLECAESVIDSSEEMLLTRLAGAAFGSNQLTRFIFAIEVKKEETERKQTNVLKLCMKQRNRNRSEAQNTYFTSWLRFFH